ncbi:hypothetical protein [Ruminococcus sp.]|nr:hypothetical protein [Ruminococcus sp.]MEE1262189.1 hypothetical protein [Ruminococcus sp.]
MAVIERFGGCRHGSVSRKRETKKQNQNCNKASLTTEKEYEIKKMEI